MGDVNVHKNHRKRMRDKYEKYGADVFDTHQLYEMLLFHSQRQGDTNPIAHNFLIDHPDGAAGAQSSEELCDADGIGPNSANLIRISFDTTVRILCDRLCRSAMESDFTVRAFLWLWFKNKPGHTVCALLLNDKKRLLDCCVLTLGKSSVAEEYLSVLLQAMKSCDATGVILGHNHKTNICEPSLEDIYLTGYLKNHLAKKGYTLLDHYIVTDTDCVPCKFL